jgi:hypothetical protein
MDEGELRLSIVGYLRGVGKESKPNEHAHADVGMAPKPRRLLLLVDEADSLPIRLLEELRALTNIAAGGVPLVSLVLAGSPILEERFADPQLDMFSQRIAARCYLAALGREETFQYVRSQVAAAGMKPERLLAAEALEAMYSATAGVPRLVNQLGDQLVWMAEQTGCTPLDAALVQQAWSDLQQLPAPWNTEGHAAHATSPSGMATSATAEMVEFGELDGAFADDINHRGPRASLPPLEDTADDDGDEELPASIPLMRAFDGRDGKDLVDFQSAIEVTEDLVGRLEDFDADEPVASGATEGEPAAPLAVNPFAESFPDEEVLVDRYAEFESHMLRRAPQVRNRIDPDFATELSRSEVKAKPIAAERAPGKPDPAPAERAPAASSKGSGPRVILAPVALPISAAGDLLLIEDDDRDSPIVVPGRQFRRLFSRLEASAALAR